MNSIPEELKVNARWVCCTADKRPICPATGAPASSTDPATWASYAAAVQAVPRLAAAASAMCWGMGSAGSISTIASTLPPESSCPKPWILWKPCTAIPN